MIDYELCINMYNYICLLISNISNNFKNPYPNDGQLFTSYLEF